MSKKPLTQQTEFCHIENELLYKYLPEGEWITGGRIGRPNERAPVTLRDLYLYVRLQYNRGTPIAHVLDNCIFAGETKYMRWTTIPYDELLNIIEATHREFLSKPKYTLRQALKQVRRELAEPVIKGGVKLEVRGRDFMLREREEFVNQMEYEPTCRELRDFSQDREKYIRGGYLETIVVAQAVRTTVDILVSLFVNSLVTTIDLALPPIGHVTIVGGEIDHYLETIRKERIQSPSPRDWLTNVDIDIVASQYISVFSPNCIIHPTTFCDQLHTHFLPGIMQHPKKSHCIALNTALMGERGEHWVFLGYHGDIKTLVYYDSGASKLPKPVQKHVRELFVPMIAKIKLPLFRSQYSESECGIYVLLMMYYFVQHQEDIILRIPLTDLICYEVRSSIQNALRLFGR